MLEFGMMVAFIVATGLGMYKFYVIFEKSNADGVDIKIIEEELGTIIMDILQKEKNISKEELYAKVFEDENFDAKRYFNFNFNRFNQILKKLFIEHKVDSFDALREKL